MVVSARDIVIAIGIAHAERVAQLRCRRADLLAILERPIDRDVPGQQLPFGQRGAVVLGCLHHLLAVMIVRQQTVDAVDLERHEGLRAGGFEGELLLAARGSPCAASTERSTPSCLRQGAGTARRWPGSRATAAAVPVRRRSRPREATRGGPLRGRPRPPRTRRGGARSRRGPMRRSDHPSSPAASATAFSRSLTFSATSQQAALLDVGERQDPFLDLGTGGEVRGGDPHGLLRPPDVEPSPLENVDATVGRGERGGDVAVLVEVDHAMRAARRAADGVVGARVRADLEVYPVAAAAEPTHQLGDEPFAFRRAHARDHRHARVQVQREGRVTGLDRQPFEVHVAKIDHRGPRLEPNDPLDSGHRPSSGGRAPRVGRRLARAGLQVGIGEAAVARCRACKRRLPDAVPAPLAQSAERFHGKEKVVSSILTGGSPAGRWPRSGRRSSVG